MSDPTKPPPVPPGPLDHEDPPDGARPKSPKAPKRPKPPPQDGDTIPPELDDAAQPRVTLGFTPEDRRALRILAAERGYPSLSAMLKAEALINLKNARANGFKH